MDLAPDLKRLLNRGQRDFPLTPRPFADLGRELGMTEAETMAAAGRLLEQQIVGRIGAVVRPNTAGASTLAAVAAPLDRVDAVADIISAQPEVNHNYEREHDLNIWFVVAAADRQAVADVLARIGAQTGLEVVDLPLERAYHIDLGFSL